MTKYNGTAANIIVKGRNRVRIATGAQGAGMHGGGRTQGQWL